ncbi:MAG: hypothetical protein COA94_00790 [Rickettsiales bacterium]|nr:MAG: hypothetical protein COA94_00790 [Rickettsiales bacterium]
MSKVEVIMAEVITDKAKTPEVTMAEVITDNDATTSITPFLIDDTMKTMSKNFLAQAQKVSEGFLFIKNQLLECPPEQLEISLHQFNVASSNVAGSLGIRAMVQDGNLQTLILLAKKLPDIIKSMFGIEASFLIETLNFKKPPPTDIEPAQDVADRELARPSNTEPTTAERLPKNVEDLLTYLSYTVRFHDSEILFSARQKECVKLSFLHIAAIIGNKIILKHLLTVGREEGATNGMSSTTRVDYKHNNVIHYLELWGHKDVEKALLGDFSSELNPLRGHANSSGNKPKAITPSNAYAAFKKNIMSRVQGYEPLKVLTTEILMAPQEETPPMELEQKVSPDMPQVQLEASTTAPVIITESSIISYYFRMLLSDNVEESCKLLPAVANGLVALLNNLTNDINNSTNRIIAHNYLCYLGKIISIYGQTEGKLLDKVTNLCAAWGNHEPLAQFWILSAEKESFTPRDRVKYMLKAQSAIEGCTPETKVNFYKLRSSLGTNEHASNNALKKALKIIEDNGLQPNLTELAQIIPFQIQYCIQHPNTPGSSIDKALELARLMDDKFQTELGCSLNLYCLYVNLMLGDDNAKHTVKQAISEMDVSTEHQTAQKLYAPIVHEISKKILISDLPENSRDLDTKLIMIALNILLGAAKYNEEGLELAQTYSQKLAEHPQYADEQSAAASEYPATDIGISSYLYLFKLLTNTSDEPISQSALDTPPNLSRAHRELCEEVSKLIQFVRSLSGATRLPTYLDHLSTTGSAAFNDLLGNSNPDYESSLPEPQNNLETAIDNSVQRFQGLLLNILENPDWYVIPNELLRVNDSLSSEYEAPPSAPPEELELIQLPNPDVPCAGDAAAGAGSDSDTGSDSVSV